MSHVHLGPPLRPPLQTPAGGVAPPPARSSRPARTRSRAGRRVQAAAATGRRPRTLVLPWPASPARVSVTCPQPAASPPPPPKRDHPPLNDQKDQSGRPKTANTPEPGRPCPPGTPPRTAPLPPRRTPRPPGRPHPAAPAGPAAPGTRCAEARTAAGPGRPRRLHVRRRHPPAGPGCGRGDCGRPWCRWPWPSSEPSRPGRAWSPFGGRVVTAAGLVPGPASPCCRPPPPRYGGPAPGPAARPGWARRRHDHRPAVRPRPRTSPPPPRPRRPARAGRHTCGCSSP